MIPNLLTIAGSDSGGGAGIQADIKTFSALGGYAMSAVTALTAQNTRGVTAVQMAEPAFVAAQIDAVFGDIRVDAVKLGMLGSAEIVRAVADRLRVHAPRYVVVDPVMVAKGGDRLLREDAVAALREEILPLAGLLTPNLPEAAVLLGEAEPPDIAAMAAAGERLLALGPAWVLVKGGHLHAAPDSTDILLGSGTRHEFSAPRLDTRRTHGTGCTLSAAIAALLPRMGIVAAVGAAKDYLQGALQAADALDVGGAEGHGPLHHFHALWR